MLIGLKGSKSILTFFSLPSSVTIVPQYTTKPLGGTGKGRKKPETMNIQRRTGAECFESKYILCFKLSLFSKTPWNNYS